MAEKKTNDIEFVEFVIKGLVDHPEDVKVDRKVDEMGVLLSLKVHPEDMGQIIGKAGSTARSIRNLVRIVGLKNHARVNLKIEEPEVITAEIVEEAPVEAPEAPASTPLTQLQSLMWSDDIDDTHVIHFLIAKKVPKISKKTMLADVDQKVIERLVTKWEDVKAFKPAL